MGEILGTTYFVRGGRMGGKKDIVQVVRDSGIQQRVVHSSNSNPALTRARRGHNSSCCKHGLVP